MMWDLLCSVIFEHCPNGYAKAYAKAGIGMTGEERRVQALYISNNISHWRGEKAKDCRKMLKSFNPEQ